MNVLSALSKSFVPSHRLARTLGAPELVTKLVNGALFQIGWFCAVVGGDLWASTAAISMLLIHFLFFSGRAREWLLIVVVTATGALIDSCLINRGVLLTGDASLSIPLWLVCIWLMFAMTLCHVMSWLQQRLIVAAALGAVMGPVSYASGARLGDMTLGEPLLQSLALLSVCWAMLMPLLMWAARYGECRDDFTS